MNNQNSLAVLFITLNEEYHIGAAIENVADIANEIIVIDSGSTDKTVEIAESKGAKVIYHKFENFGAQWNFALTQPTATRWVMKMDPDERLSEELKSELVRVMREPGDNVGYEFDRILWFMGKPMRGWKDRVVRLWLNGRCRFTDAVVNEHPLVDGPVSCLRGHMDHLDSRSLHDWVEKQNKYTTQGAMAALAGCQYSVTPRFFGSRLERRMWFKKIFFKLPGRYFLMFIHLYIGKSLWREGVTGYWCALMRIWVRRCLEGKVIEARNLGNIDCATLQA